MTISDAYNAGVAALAAQRTKLASIEEAIETPRPGDLHSASSRDALNNRPDNLLVIQLGAADDFITASTYADRVRGGAGNDTILAAADGVFQFQGGPGDDELRANANDGNHLAGGPGQDNLIGGEGQDNMRGGSGDDVLFGDAQNDTLQGGTGDDTINAGADDDEVSGQDGADLLNGGSGNDTVRGNGGNDLLLGDLGDDLLNGGRGNDVLDGGSGSDRYVFKAGSGHDTIDAFDAAGTASTSEDSDQIVVHDLDGELRTTTEEDGSLRLWIGDEGDRSVKVTLNDPAAGTPDFTHEQILAALNIVLR